MRLSDLYKPYRSMSDAERLEHIRQVRFRRSVEKPRKIAVQKRAEKKAVNKEATSKVKKAQLALDMLTPEQIEQLRKMHNV